MARTYKDELSFLRQISPVQWEISPGFVPNMRVKGSFFVNESLRELLFDELEHYSQARGVGGFLPAVKQIANVAALPGIVKASIGLPDVHQLSKKQRDQVQSWFLRQHIEYHLERTMCKLMKTQLKDLIIESSRAMK